MPARRPGAAVHEGSTAGIDQLTEVLGDAVRTLDEHGIGYVLIGGQASSLLGRPRCSSDVDILVAPEDAPPALDALARAGFRTERINPHWLFKAFRRDVLVDLLFKVRGEIYLDEETPRHWGDALAILPVTDLDWDYFLVRAQRAPRRMLSFLCYASSVDLPVPMPALRELGRLVMQ